MSSEAIKKLAGEGLGLRKKADGGDFQDVLWAIADFGGLFNDQAAIASSVLPFLGAAFDCKKKAGNRIPNPYFLDNGFDYESPVTYKYFVGRKNVNLAGSLTSAGGSLASGVTMVDTAGIAQAGNALGSTTAHIIGVRAAGAKFKKSQTVTAWIDAIIKAKAAKIGLRSVNMAASAIPVPAVGLGLGAAAAVAKLGIRVSLYTLMRRTALDIHWRAFQEINVARKAGPVGPASSIFYEIFTRRGVTRLFGKHDTEALIREPCGWEALSDKLLMM